MKISEIEAKLAAIEKTCPSQFKSFTHTYWIVTKNIGAKLGTGYFDDDSAVEELDSHFFDLFEAAITKPHAAWRRLKVWKGDLVNLWLGANAHINHDLPVALRQSKITKADYEKIVQVLEASIPQILKDLFPELPNKGSATRITKKLVRRWRARAWQQAKGGVE